MLRDYQEEICGKVKEALGKHRSVMMQMPTGTGKTVVLAELVQRFLHEYARESVLIVAHRIELIEQTGGFLSHFGIDYGVIAGGKWPARFQQVMVASIQTLSKNLDLGLDLNPSLVVIDEAHHALAKTYQMLWEAWPEARFLGLTATPYRMSGDGFTDLFEVLVDSWSIKQFIADGWLSPYDYYSIRPDSEEQQEIDSLKKRGADGDFQLKELREKLDVRPSIERLYDSFRRFASDKKGIVYAIDIAHAEHIAAYYRQQGVAAVAISSRTPLVERKRVIGIFANIGNFSNHPPTPSFHKEGASLTPGPLSSREGSNRSAALCSDIMEDGGIKAHSSVLPTHVPCDSSSAASSVASSAACDFSSASACDSVIQVLVSVDLFSEGFDCPDVEFIQLARPTLSLAKYLQMVGRGLRPCKGKACCTILDNVGLYRTFGLPSVDRDWNAYFVGQELYPDLHLGRNEQFLWLGCGDLPEEMDTDIVRIVSHEGMQSQFTKLNGRGFERRKRGKAWVWIDRMNGMEFDRHPQVINYRGMELSTADGETFFPRISSKWIDAKHGINRKALETQAGEGISWMKLYVSFVLPDKVLQLQAVKPNQMRIYKDELGKVFLQQDLDHAPVCEEEAGGRKAFMALCDREQRAWEERKKSLCKRTLRYDAKQEGWQLHRPVLRKRGFVELLHDGDVVYILNIREERFMPYRNWEIRADERICTIGNKLYLREEKDGSSYRIKKRSDDFRMFVVERRYPNDNPDRIAYDEFTIINKAGMQLEIKTSSYDTNIHRRIGKNQK